MWSLISFSQFLGTAFLYVRLIIWQSLFKECQRCHGGADIHPSAEPSQGKVSRNVPGWSFIGQSGVMCTSLHQSPQPASHWLNQVTCVLQNKGVPVGMDWEVERDSSLRKTWKAFSKVWGWGAGWAETPDVNFIFHLFIWLNSYILYLTLLNVLLVVVSD